MTITGGDIKLIFDGTTPDTLGPADIEIPAGSMDPLRDTGLETAVLIAVFTDRRADEGDELPNASDTRGGYFIDTVTGTPIGSKLWLLGRKRLNADTLSRAKQYIEDALQTQILDEGLAAEMEVDVTAESGKMKIGITLTGFDGTDLFYTYYLNWQSQTGRG